MDKSDKAKTKKAEPDTRFQKDRPRWVLFKTLDARVNFMTLAIVLIFTGIGVFLAYSLRSSYPIDLIIDPNAAMAADVRATYAITVAALLAFVTFLFSMIMGDFLISKRARRIAKAMAKVMGGEAKASSIPRGMGELDGITEIYDQCMQELQRTEEGVKQQIKAGVSEAELSRGLTELQMARLESLLASMSDGVVATDKAGAISFVNAVARQALWWRDANVQGVDVTEGFQLEDEKETIIAPGDWPVWPALKEGRVVVTPAPSKPYYLRRADQSRFPAKLTFSPVRVDEEVVGALMLFSDITDEVEFDRRKSEFISVASHQLRSPSSAIRMMTDMMRKGDFGAFNDKQQEWVEKLYESSDHMVELINQLLSISRLEAGVKMAPEEQDTNAWLDETVDSSRSLLAEKQQQLDYQRPDLPVLTFDRFMIGEVIKNLLSNAVKYSPQGSTIAIRAELTDWGVRFSVKDQGMGVPQADRSQMFNKFFRAGNALKSAIQGTGLGLFFCKAAVEKHGGQIGFASEEGQGTTFWFTLPSKSMVKPDGSSKGSDIGPTLDDSGRRVESSLAT